MGLSSIQVEPRVQEEPPIEESWELAEVRVEQVDERPHYPSSAPDSVTYTWSATFSGAPILIAC